MGRKLTDPFKDLPRGYFGTILADPPWTFTAYSGKGKARSAERHYDTMSTEEIAQLPVASLAADDCCLFMWVSWPLLPEALRIIERWGFCVATGTKILTDDLRWIPAETVTVGQRLLCFDNHLVNGRRYYRWGHVISTGLEQLPCHQITMNNGRKLIASNEHKWLAHDGAHIEWATAMRMKDDYNGRRSRKWRLPSLAPTSFLEDTFDAGFLSAAFDSEGYLRKSKCGLSFSQKQNSLMNRIQSLLETRGFKFKEYSYPEYHAASQLIIGNRNDALRFLMQFRPPRLLDNWLKGNPPASLYNSPLVDIDKIEDVGVRQVVTLQTDVGTYIAEGFGAHNTYKTCGFDWMKAHTGQIDMFRDDADVQVGMGYWTRSNTEPCLLATRGNPKRLNADVRMGIIEPRREHSRKPDIVYNRIERLVAGPYLDLFARQSRCGWTTWGAESTKFDRVAFQESVNDCYRCGIRE